MTYSLIYISSPSIINYRIAEFCFSKETKDKLHFEKYDSIRLNDFDSFTGKDKTRDIPLYVSASFKESSRLDGDTPNITPKKIDVTSVEVKKDTVDANKINTTKVEDNGRDEVDMRTREVMLFVGINYWNMLICFQFIGNDRDGYFSCS